MNTEKRAVSAIKLIGGRLCLDFVNTIGGRRPDLSHARKTAAFYTIRDEKLNDYPDLVAWARRVELLTEPEARQLAVQARRNEPEASVIWKRAIQLRESIYRICTGRLSGEIPQASDLEVLNRELQAAFDRTKLSMEKSNFHWEWTNATGSLERILWPIADSAAAMLTEGDLTRLRQCSGDDCGWLFEDTTRNRSRHWCDMKDCGNTAKVRRFRSRIQKRHR
ncbi:ABATE domain-containing protein [bacterium]|nr:ABATE domain-containing protein [bacterium]